MKPERTRAHREVARVLRSVARDVSRRRLFPTDVFERHVVVGCSGGGDSVALARILARLRGKLGISLVLVGVDHGLRAGAARELDLVEALARELEVPFERARVTLDLRGRSLQAAAREARYAALREVAIRTGASRIAVGHTLDDQAETVLAAALRGKSLSALRGIAWRRADGVVRPLLGQRRAVLREWLDAGGHPYVDDPSNEDLRFERVQVRALTPSLEAIDPRASEHLAALAEEARGASAALRARARRWRVRAEVADEGPPEGRIDEGRIDEGRIDEGRLEEGRLDEGRLDEGRLEVRPEEGASGDRRGEARALRLSVLRAASTSTRREVLRAWLEEHGPMRSGITRELEAIVGVGRGEVVISEGRAVRVERGLLRLGTPRGVTRRRARGTSAADPDEKSRSPRGDD